MINGIMIIGDETWDVCSLLWQDTDLHSSGVSVFFLFFFFMSLVLVYIHDIN